MKIISTVCTVLLVAMVTYNLLGKVYKIVNEDGGSKTLIISTNIPYHTIFKKFRIWDVNQLSDNSGRQIEVDGHVQVTFNDDTGHPRLTEIDTVFLESCAYCYNFYEQGLSYVFSFCNTNKNF